MFVDLFQMAQLFNQDAQIQLWVSQIEMIYETASSMYVDSEGQLKMQVELSLFSNALLDDLNIKIHERLHYLTRNPQALRKCHQ